MPGGQEKRRRSQDRYEAHSSLSYLLLGETDLRGIRLFLFFVNTANYCWAANQLMVTDAVQKGEGEGKGKDTSADYCLL